MLKKISNSLSTDNSIPIFGYSINEADIASASFFCVLTALYKAVFCPLLCHRSHFTNKAAAFIPLPRCQFCPTFGMPFRKECHVGKYASLLPPSFFIDVVGRTAARARSAQGASQFAAGYAAVRLPHHSCAHHENKLSYSSPVPVDIPGFTGAKEPDSHTWPTTERGNNGARMQQNKYKRDRPERDGLILCFGSQETAMLCNQLLLGSLSSFSLLVPYVCIIHNRSTDEDGCVSTEADTEYQGYGKTTDRLTAEDCDSKHCHESRY